jgi:hypothetical protein
VDYLVHQLQLAHRRNDLVDDLRFKVFQIFFAFHGLIITALIFAGERMQYVRSELGPFRAALPTLVLLVGFCLFTMFARWHAYLYSYKGWIANLEDSLRHRVFGVPTERVPAEYTGTYYLDKNSPRHSLEAIGALTSACMAGLTLGLSATLFHLLQVSTPTRAVVLVLGVLAHGIVASLVFKKWNAGAA